MFGIWPMTPPTKTFPGRPDRQCDTGALIAVDDPRR
jgi:hypothetical protein